MNEVVKSEGIIDEPKVRAMLCGAFPDMVAEIENNYGEGLIHVELALL